MDKKSILVQIKKGTPDWDKPLMDNLYLLEKKIDSLSDIDINELEEIKSKITLLGYNFKEHEKFSNEEFESINNSILRLKNKDLQNIKKDIIALRENIKTCENDILSLKKDTYHLKENYSLLENKINNILDDIVKINDNFIVLKNTLEEIQNDLSIFSNNIDKNKEDIIELQKSVLNNSTNIEELNDKNIVLKKQLDINTNNIELNKEEIGKNTIEIDSLKQEVKTIDEKINNILEDKANFHFVVNEIKDLPSVESQKIENGSLCYVRNQNKLFIFDNLWKELSTGGTSGSVLWADILNKPKSTVKDIDLSVVAMHTHTNKEALDSISFKKISDWDNKPLKEDIPTKISQLENDKKYITLDEAPVFDDSGIKTSITELENNKANKNHTHNGKDIMFDENKNIIDKISDIELNINSIPSQEYLDSKLEDKADKSALNAIVTQIADNKELWEKDTIYDDTSIKTELEKKADKSSLLSIFTQENEPKEMKSGDQWHQIIE